MHGTPTHPTPLRSSAVQPPKILAPWIGWRFMRPIAAWR